MNEFPNSVPINSAVASVVVLSRRQDEIRMLLMRRAKEGFWCHVAGSIEAGEKAWQTVLREMDEETGLQANTLYSADYIEQFYESERNCITMVPGFVAWVSEDADVVLNEEHVEYRWCLLDEAIALTEFANQHAFYQHVWRYFVEGQASAFLRVKTDS